MNEITKCKNTVMLNEDNFLRPRPRPNLRGQGRGQNCEAETEDNFRKTKIIYNNIITLLQIINSRYTVGVFR